VGEVLSANVVRELAGLVDESSINILDAAPGTGCTVVRTIEKADVVLLVTEPTPFGLHDLKLAAELALTLRVPTAIIVNRSDGSDRLIRQYAEDARIPVVGEIPFRRQYAESCSAGEVLVDRYPDLTPTLTEIYRRAVKVASETVAAPPSAELREYEPVRQDPGFHEDGRAAGPAGSTIARNGHEIVMVSGKGGTGKTTIAAAFALLDGRKVLADTDVNAADLHLLVETEMLQRGPFVGGQKAYVDPTICDGCGLCAESYRFDAFGLDGPGNRVVDATWRVDPFSCEGCGLCAEVCPRDAIELRDTVTGELFVSSTRNGPLAHARLGIAQENSGRLVTHVRKRAAELAARQPASLMLGDGPPGIGCPVIASLTGIDLAVLVTEPTVSAINDLDRALDLAGQLQVPARIIINKCDLNRENADRIRAMAKERDAGVLGCIPFDAAVNDALMAGKSIIEWDRSIAARAIRAVWTRTCSELEALKNGGVHEGSSDISR
jgi:MinD superfamily P-loop ATPase